jgi:hypothetical protein
MLSKKISKSCCAKMHISCYKKLSEKSIMLVTKILCVWNTFDSVKLKNPRKPKNFCQELEISCSTQKMNVLLRGLRRTLFEGALLHQIYQLVCIKGPVKALWRKMEAIIFKLFMPHSVTRWVMVGRKLKQSCGCVFKTATMNREKSSKNILKGKNENFGF